LIEWRDRWQSQPLQKFTCPDILWIADRSGIAKARRKPADENGDFAHGK
jgi:hypothetical protein